MGTRSDIIVQHTDGSWKRIYCHWDGYLDHNGKILAAHYATQKLAESLVAPGDLSSLAEKCTKPKGHTYQTPVKGYSVYYGRDRGEHDVTGLTGATLQEVWPPEDTWTEFTYVWSRTHGAPDGMWYVADPDEGTQTLVSLQAALDGGDNPHPKIEAFGTIILGRHS